MLLIPSEESQRIIDQTQHNRILDAPQLFALRSQVDAANKLALEKLPFPLETFKAQDSGSAFERAKLDDCFLAPSVLHLKKGAKVIYLRNHKTISGYL